MAQPIGGPVRWRFLLLVFGMSLIVLGCREIMLWRVASRSPQTLTCAALGLHGPGGNAHVVLREFLLCHGAFVYEEKRGQWTQAWVPAVPVGSAFARQAGDRPAGDRSAGDRRMPPGRDVRVLVKMPKARSVADVVNAAHQDSLQGMVVNEIESLGRSEKATLERSYPEVDFDACWIFELGRAPSGFEVIAGSLGGGIALIVFMLWLSLGGPPVRTQLRPEPVRMPARTAELPAAAAAAARPAERP
jgi:hypothetical protein